MDYPKSVPNVGLVNGKFVDESAATGQVGSLIPASWGNAVTDELLNVIRAGGQQPEESKNDQLAAAIKTIVRDSIPPEKIRTTLAEYGITDAYTKSMTYTKVEIDALAAQASEVNRGTVKIASQVQMLADTNDSVAVTPKKLRLGFSISLAANGYIVFPTWMGGLIVQWGSGASSGGNVENVSIAMPLAWPTGSFAENATIVGSDTGTHTVLRGAMTVNTMKFTTLRNGAYASGITIRWIAVGY